jgi:hypothetical protein
VGLPPEIITPRDHRHGSKLGDIIRRLSSTSDGEVVAGVRAMQAQQPSAAPERAGIRQ